MKRIMAGEHSRLLSTRVFDAQVYLLEHGFKPGGAAGYGLRRLSVRADGTVRRALGRDERKCHQTDRVVLAPGPVAEVEVVRQMFQSYIEEGLSYAALARRLNQQGIAGPSGGLWRDGQVRAVLTNEKYCGNLLYNRTSGKLGTRRSTNAPEAWHRCVAAHAAIVPPAVFAAAQRQHAVRCGGEREAVLDTLHAIYARHGRLSSRLLAAEPGGPQAARLKKLFGSVEQAYRLALGDDDWPPQRMAAVWSAALARQLQARVCACIDRAGHRVRPTPRRQVLLLDEQWTLRIATASCMCKGGCLGWRVPAQRAGCDFVICGLRAQGGDRLLHFALLCKDQNSPQDKWLPVDFPAVAGLVVSASLEALFGLSVEMS